MKLCKIGEEMTMLFLKSSAALTEPHSKSNWKEGTSNLSDFSLSDGQQTTRDHPKKSAPIDANVGTGNLSNSGTLRKFVKTKRTPAFIQSVEQNAKFGEERPSTHTRDNA